MPASPNSANFGAVVSGDDTFSSISPIQPLRFLPWAVCRRLSGKLINQSVRGLIELLESEEAAIVCAIDIARLPRELLQVLALVQFLAEIAMFREGERVA